MKNEKKQSVLHDGQPTYHCDTLAADHTDCVKLVLWEGKIDGVLQKVIPLSHCEGLMMTNMLTLITIMKERTSLI